MGNIRLNFIDSKNVYGTMNTGTVKYSNLTDSDKKMLMLMNDLKSVEQLQDHSLTKFDKNAIFRKHRHELADKEGFEWGKMFMADQNDKSGTSFELTEDYVEANPEGWTDIREDILIITDKVPGVVVGHPVADCPVVIMEDKTKGVAAVCHCSAELIDKKMPMMVADALSSKFNSKDEDITAYVSACAGDAWTYNSYPNWATDEAVWKNGIIPDEKGLYHINLRNALADQFVERKIKNVVYSPVDTITNSDYYSNSTSSPYGLNDPTKYGRNFIGAVYQEKGKARTR